MGSRSFNSFWIALKLSEGFSRTGSSGNAAVPLEKADAVLPCCPSFAGASWGGAVNDIPVIKSLIKAMVSFRGKSFIPQESMRDHSLGQARHGSDKQHNRAIVGVVGQDWRGFADPILTPGGEVKSNLPNTIYSPDGRQLA